MVRGTVLAVPYYNTVTSLTSSLGDPVPFTTSTRSHSGAFLTQQRFWKSGSRPTNKFEGLTDEEERQGYVGEPCVIYSNKPSSDSSMN